MSENRFQVVIKVGGAVLALSLVGNLYLVLRNIEAQRDAGRWDQQAQQMALKTQVAELVLREFNTRAGSDAGIARILAHSQTATLPAPAKSATGGRR